jgi:cytochrome c biogenesis protein ResB
MRPSIWKQFTSLHVSLLLMLVIAGFSVVGIFLPQAPTSAIPLSDIFSSDTVFFLRKTGLADVFHSRWFVGALFILILNLIAVVVDRFPAVWKESRATAIAPIELTQRKPGRDMKSYVEVKSAIGREEFRDLVKDFAKRRRLRLGKLQSIRDEGGFNELQLGTRTGRFSRAFSYAGHLGLLLILAGFLVDYRSGFHGQITLDEGKTASVAQLTEGDAPIWWNPIIRDGKEVSGFYETGFEIHAERIAVSQTGAATTTLRMRRGEELSEVRQTQTNAPVSFDGIRFHQGPIAKNGRFSVTLIVRPRGAQASSEQVIRLDEAQEASVDGITYKVIEVREQIEELGSAARIETREKGKPIERFWVFQGQPNYDVVNRKGSRHVVMIYAVRPHHSSTLLIARAPGAPWTAVGAALLFLGLLLQQLSPRNRHWYIWNEGRVAIAGHSNRKILFDPAFEKTVREFLSKLAKTDRGFKNVNQEIRYGSL